eukprot:CAMPEP_0182429602 /NCGR_PEP_ID=MMETSP1167-20130531/31472_1 /TAXON_ID=2988 /ORGANISM="Mallomonas Sp, Strain CCMP3275" /LENGTH=262 /DNA_ID=CAMNT_0024613521 /DNA_START=52 /DNA_END=837 /DNA_ORIENTATION=-
MARKCLGNRTLAFIGDSQIRDLSVGVAYLLLGQDVMSSSEDKFDSKHKLEWNATKIQDFHFWKNNVPGHNYNGHIFPLPEVAATHHYQWQVQTWSLYMYTFLENQVDDVLTNKVVKYNKLLRPIDLAFWSHGLHDWGWWFDPPYGKKYFDQMVSKWIDLKDRMSVPSVWVSMNPECTEKLLHSPAVAFKAESQAESVEEANAYTNKKCKKMKLPYWDAAAALRVPERCNLSSDGVHVKMFVDIMRAKMLFNHLCDLDMRWRG